jgi:hypothetical protein
MVFLLIFPVSLSGSGGCCIAICVSHQICLLNLRDNYSRWHMIYACLAANVPWLATSPPPARAVAVCATRPTKPAPAATRAPGVITGPPGGTMAQRDPMAAALMHRPQAAHVCRDGRWLVCDGRERRGAYARLAAQQRRRRAEPNDRWERRQLLHVQSLRDLQPS